MEVPPQQSADDVLAAAREAGLLRRHPRMRGQDTAGAQGQLDEHLLIGYGLLNPALYATV